MTADDFLSHIFVFHAIHFYQLLKFDYTSLNYANVRMSVPF